jgi:uncharacterized protein YdeI (YjbR/CyaY-like superfamily)
MISEIEDYFARGCGRCDRFDTQKCSTRRWATGLATVREICVSSGLKETVKWGHPCYMHADRNIAIVGALLDDFRLSFFNAALMTDPDHILEKQGPNTRFPDMIRFTSNIVSDDLREVIASYLDEAKGYAETGKKPPQDKSEFDLPDELVEALEADPVLAEAFHALTRGRRNSYVIAIGSAKKSETRMARIEKFRDKIIAGKGAMER